MKDKKPLISVIVPVYNGAGFLVQSVNSVLNQTRQVAEIIIVDDGSTDDTKKVVEQFGEKVIYHYQENAGPAAARNTGIKISTGTHLAFLDADDLWVKDKLLWQAAQFENTPGLEISLGFTQRFLSHGVTPPPGFDPEKDTGPQLVLHLGAGLFSKSVFGKIGLFDEKMLFSEDIDWFLRSIESKRNISVLEKTVLKYRIHHSNLTHDTARNQHYLLRAFKASLDRRRKKDQNKPAPLPDIFNPERLMKYLTDVKRNNFRDHGL